MKQYVKTTCGTMPLEDYLDITAMKYGYSSYEELKEDGLSIEIPETIEVVQIFLSQLYESGRENLHFGGTIRFSKEDDNSYYDLYQDTIPFNLLLCEAEEVMVLGKNDNFVEVENLATNTRIIFTQEEFELAAV